MRSALSGTVMESQSSAVHVHSSVVFWLDCCFRGCSTSAARLGERIRVALPVRWVRLAAGTVQRKLSEHAVVFLMIHDFFFVIFLHPRLTRK